MMVPISLLLFFSFHFLHKLLKHYKLGIKSLFKSYSLPYGIILIVFVENISRLSFLACHNFTHLFSFNSKLYYLQGTTVIFVGLLFILSISFFYNTHYLYDKRIKFISSNLRRIKLWGTIQVYRFVVRPIVEIVCNVFFF